MQRIDRQRTTRPDRKRSANARALTIARKRERAAKYGTATR